MWNRREKEKLHVQQMELMTISHEEHITQTSVYLDEVDVDSKPASVDQPEARGASKTFSQFLRSTKRRATRRHGVEEKVPEQDHKSSTLPASVAVTPRV